MKSMIVVACLAVACGAHASGWVGPPANIALSQDGRNILDTPEVAQARSAHLQALQQASQNNPNPQDDGSYDPRWNSEEYWQGAQQKWNGASNGQWNGANNGQWNAGNNGQWNGANDGQWNGANDGQWNGDEGKWNGDNGQWNANHGNQWNAAPAAQSWNAGPAPVAETPEVAQARAAHLAALNSANSAPAHNQWNAPANNQWNAPAHNQWNGAPSWQGPPAQIRLAQNGAGILETPEVAAARAAHLAAHSQVSHAAPAHPQQHW